VRNDEQQREDWAVTFIYQAASDGAQLVQLGETLDAYDASVAAIPPDRMTITMHVQAVDPGQALVKAQDLLATAVGGARILAGARPLAAEAVTEAEHERRAEAPTLPKLVGASEVGSILGVSRQRVHQLRDLAGFPAPLVEVAMGPLWDARAIEAFERDWNRRPGRRRLAVAQ